MGVEFSPEKIQQMKDEAYESIKEVMDEFRRDHPKVVDAAAAAVGSTIGGGASFTALYFGGAVAGLSASGITSGLVAAGTLVGGGMVAGIGVLAAPMVVLGVAGVLIAQKRRNAKLAVALNRAIEKLYAIQDRLMANAEYFRGELAELRAYITVLEKQLDELKTINQKLKNEIQKLKNRKP